MRIAYGQLVSMITVVGLLGILAAFQPVFSELALGTNKADGVAGVLITTGPNMLIVGVIVACAMTAWMQSRRSVGIISSITAFIVGGVCLIVVYQVVGLEVFTDGKGYDESGKEFPVVVALVSVVPILFAIGVFLGGVFGIFALFSSRRGRG